MVSEVIRESGVVELRSHCTICKESLDFRRKIQCAIGVMHVIKWLDAEAIPGEEQLAFPPVPYSESEHPPQAFHNPCSLFLIQVKNGLCITVGSIRVPSSLEVA